MDHAQGATLRNGSSQSPPIPAPVTNRKRHRRLRPLSLEEFWPAHLSLYPHSAIAIPAWQWILSALILISVTALVLAFRRKSYLPVGWFWFLGTLVPVIGLVQVGEASMADRYAYIPLVGIFLMISFGLADLAEAKAQAKAEVQAKAQAKAEVQAKAQAKDVGIARQPIPALALCALAALSFLTHRQIAYWDSDYDLWAHTLAIAENPVAHDAMGSALLDPDLAITPNNRDDLDTEQKRMDEARRHFERAIEMRRQLATQNPAAYLPDMANTLNHLGNLNRLQGKTDDARKHSEEALKIHLQLSQQNQEPFPPDLAQTLNNLGSLEKNTMQIDAADRHFKAALKIYREMAQQDPDDYLPKVAEILNNLGFVARSEAISEARLEAKLEARPEANSEANSEARSEAKSERKSEGRSERSPKNTRPIARLLRRSPHNSPPAGAAGSRHLPSLPGNNLERLGDTRRAAKPSRRRAPPLR